MNKKIKIGEYLSEKGILFRESNGEVITKCLFNDCDRDSKGAEAHLYFSADTGQGHCKKCDWKGNIFTLAQHFGEGVPEIRTSGTMKKELVEKCHQALPVHIREYLNKRGLTDAVIDAHKLGYGQFYRKSWITIPIKDCYGNYSFFKLRQDPEQGNDKITYPKGIEAQIYDWEMFEGSPDQLVICEGEMDRLLLVSKGISAITSTHGAMTFKEEWIEKIGTGRKVYICFDRDDAGVKGAERIAKMLKGTDVNIIKLPDEVGEHGDITDYFVKVNGSVEDLFSKYSKEYPEKMDASQFKRMGTSDIAEILESTIKKDDIAKVITTLAMINTYTEESQMNIFFNAPSSTGKSHIPLSISELFPQQDLITLANCSPTAFIHEQGVFNKERNEMIVDLSRKILIFTDMPHPELLTRLRSFLSHDQKESKSKITDKSEKGGNRTKTVVMIGYPTVVFCSAGLKVDEQESTRFIMLSPSIEQDKLIAGIKQAIQKEVDSQIFRNGVDNDEKRQLFKKRIIGIKQAEISDVKIKNWELVEELFLPKDKKGVKPRHLRDTKKVICLIKGFALLNLWFRERDGDYIFATDEDIVGAFKLWDSISIGQDYGLAPYIYSIYTDVVIPLWKKQLENSDGFPPDGIKRQDILKQSDHVGRPLNMVYLRQNILPQLEQAGLIAQERSTGSDGRQMVVFPLDVEEEAVNNSEGEGGVKIK